MKQKTTGSELALARWCKATNEDRTRVGSVLGKASAKAREARRVAAAHSAQAGMAELDRAIAALAPAVPRAPLSVVLAQLLGDRAAARDCRALMATTLEWAGYDEAAVDLALNDYADGSYARLTPSERAEAGLRFWADEKKGARS